MGYLFLFFFNFQGEKGVGKWDSFGDLTQGEQQTTRTYKPSGDWRSEYWRKRVKSPLIWTQTPKLYSFVLGLSVRPVRIRCCPFAECYDNIFPSQRMLVMHTLLQRVKRVHIRPATSGCWICIRSDRATIWLVKSLAYIVLYHWATCNIPHTKLSPWFFLSLSLCLFFQPRL